MEISEKPENLLKIIHSVLPIADGSLNVLAHATSLVHWKNGEELRLRTDADGKARAFVYVIVSGALEAIRPVAKHREMVVEIYRRGDEVRQLGTARIYDSARYKVIGPTSAFQILKDRFEALVQGDISLLRHMHQRLQVRYADCVQRALFSALPLQDSIPSLFRHLIDSKDPAVQGEAIKITQERTARLIGGVARETISRVINELINAGRLVPQLRGRRRLYASWYTIPPT